jgi:hypothetical protein
MGSGFKQMVCVYPVSRLWFGGRGKWGWDGFGPVCWDSDVIAAICSLVRWFVDDVLVKYSLLEVGGSR